MSLQLRNIRLPLVDFALETDGIFDQPITGIFGPSGAGKTSLLDLTAPVFAGRSLEQSSSTRR